ncbi:uncharacterized protein [Primulina eburnea]|uniref:uncharacterized protein isoform X5 n=1 Tax=Primulina eburnea TaxID=1245227 RepID=UPI003C6C1F32
MQKVQATHCVVIMQCGINQGQSNQPLNGTMAQYWLSDSMHIESKENCILILGNGQENITEYFIHKALQNLPLIHNFDNIQLLARHINKSGRRHGLLLL